MRNHKTYLYLLLPIISLLILFSCSNSGNITGPEKNAQSNLVPPDPGIPPTPIKGSGTIRYIPLEGGFYGIVTSKGEHLDPRNLDPKFQVDKLNVAYVVTPSKDQVSFHMWGLMVDVISIEVLPPDNSPVPNK